MKNLFFILSLFMAALSLKAQNTYQIDYILKGNMSGTSLNYINQSETVNTPAPGSGWAGYFGGSANRALDIVSAVDSDTGSGQGDVIKITSTGANTDITNNARLAQRISSMPAGHYRLKFKAKATTTNSTILVPTVRVGANNVPAFVLKNYSSCGVPTHKTFTLTQTWTEYYVDYDLTKTASTLFSSATITSGITANQTPVICFSLQSPAGAELMIDDVSFISMVTPNSYIINGEMTGTSLNYVNQSTTVNTPAAGTGWAGYFGGSANRAIDIVSTVDTDVCSGQNDVIKITSTGANTDITNNARLAQRISSMPVGNYRLKFKAKATTTNTTVLVPTVRVGANNIPAFVLKDYNGTGIPTHQPFTLTSSWTEYYIDYDLTRTASALSSSATITTGITANQTPVICFSLQSPAGAELMIDDVSFISLDNNNPVELSSGNTKVVFAGGNQFNILSISSGNNNSWFEQTGLTANIWSLKIRNHLQQSNVYTSSSSTTSYQGLITNDMNGTNPTVTLNWNITTADNFVIPVKVLVSANNTTQLIDWKIEADLPNGWMVENLTFPNLSFHENAADKVIMPAGFGVEYDLPPGSSYYSGYPQSRGTVQLMCLLKGQDVFYFATHDQNANIKDFRASVSTNGIINLRNEIVTSEAWTAPDGKFELPWTASVGIGNNGWEQAVVNWYKPFTYTTPWGSKTFAAKNLPQWLLDVDIWFVPNQSHNNVLNWTIQAMIFFGPGRTASHSYVWNNKPHDTSYPDFFPAAPDFKNFVDTVKARGSHVIPYINGRLWDTTTVSYQQDQGALYLARKKDNTPYMEIYASGAPNAVVCPYNVMWHNKINAVSERIQNELETNGVYVDQLASAPAAPCWNPNHGHPLGAGDYWVTTVRTMMNTIKQNSIAGNIIATEQNAECYLDRADLMLMAATPAGSSHLPSGTTPYRQVPLFPLIYSDRMMLYGFNMYNSVRDISVRYKNMLSLLWGSQLGWFKPDFIMSPLTTTEDRNFMLRLVNFRADQHDLIYGGTLTKEIIPTGDNPLIEIPGMGGLANVVKGAHWIGSGGVSATLLVNIDDTAHTVILPNGNSVTINARDCMRIDETTLPVTLMKFDGKINSENTAVLEWVVAENADIKKFHIIKSTDGKNFSNIGTVDKNNSSYYSFTDSKTDLQGAYYKLQKIDTNNSTEYSKVIRVNSKINNGISLSAYPNPTSNALNIVFSPREETSILKIVSILGQVIYQTTVNSLEKQVVVQTEKFTPGNYIIILERGNNKEFSKFIKQ